MTPATEDRAPRPHAHLRRAGLGYALLALAAFSTAQTIDVPAPAAEVSPPAMADGAHGPFTGRLAGQAVVALFTVENGAVSGGRFFYRFHGRDLSLVPDGDGFIECPYQPGGYAQPCEKPSGRWTLAIDADAVRGQWRAKAGAPARPIELVRAASTGTPDDAYEAARIADNRIATIATRREGAIAWKVVREARSGVSMPLLTRAPDAAAMARINAALQARFHHDIGASLTAEDYQSAPEVLFANERLIAVGGLVDWSYRGAAHPSNAFVVQTFDLATGDAIDWSRRLKLVEPDGAPFDVARRNVLAAPMLREVLRVARLSDDRAACMRLVAEHYGCGGGRCEAIAPDDAARWAMWPTGAGLAVAPDVYAEVERGCRGEAVTVPWEAVRATQRVPGPLP